MNYVVIIVNGVQLVLNLVCRSLFSVEMINVGINKAREKSIVYL